MAIRVGDTAARKFVVDAGTMAWFREISEDDSRIHCDREYALSRGYTDLVVYGGIMVAHLSHLLGTKAPGANGTSLSWSIKFHEPLYVGEEAEIVLEVAYLSAATGVVEGRFTITAGDKNVATGTTQSLVPLAEIET
jgi:3-oxoacyl-[acyl-carrier protein] reductase